VQSTDKTIDTQATLEDPPEITDIASDDLRDKVVKAWVFAARYGCRLAWYSADATWIPSS
jgi:hypothetical protein